MFPQNFNYSNNLFEDFDRMNGMGQPPAPAPQAATPAPVAPAAPTPPAMTVNDLYTQILGRAPDAGGLAYWQNAFGSGPVTADQQASFMQAAQGELANRSVAEQKQLAPNLASAVIPERPIVPDLASPLVAPQTPPPPQIPVDRSYVNNLVEAPIPMDGAVQKIQEKPTITPIGTQTPTTVEDLYRTILGREGEQAGLDFWKKGFGDTIDANEIASFKQAAQKELANRTPEEQRKLAPTMVAEDTAAKAGLTPSQSLYYKQLMANPNADSASNLDYVKHLNDYQALASAATTSGSLTPAQKALLTGTNGLAAANMLAGKYGIADPISMGSGVFTQGLPQLKAALQQQAEQSPIPQKPQKPEPAAATSPSATAGQTALTKPATTGQTTPSKVSDADILGWFNANPTSDPAAIGKMMQDSKLTGAQVSNALKASPAAAQKYLAAQILSQGLTSKWAGEGLGSPEKNAEDMAKIMAATGITDIKQFGEVPMYVPAQEIAKQYKGNTVYTATDEEGNPQYQYYFEPSQGDEPAAMVRVPKDAKVETVYGLPNNEGGYDPVDKSKTKTVDGQLMVNTGQKTFGNKETGKSVANTYSERQTGNAFGGTFAGKGNTGYRVQFTPDGTPIFYTTGASSNTLLNLLQDNPLLNIAANVGASYFGGPAAVAALQAAQGKDLKDVAKGAALSYLGNQAAGAVSGAAGVKDVLGDFGSKVAGSAAKSIVASGGKVDPVQALLSGGIDTGISQILSNSPEFKSLNPTTKNIITGMLASEVKSQILPTKKVASGGYLDGASDKSNPAVDAIARLIQQQKPQPEQLAALLSLLGGKDAQANIKSDKDLYGRGLFGDTYVPPPADQDVDNFLSGGHVDDHGIDALLHILRK